MNKSDEVILRHYGRCVVTFIDMSFICFIAGLFAILLTGCGHTMFHKVEGTGLYGRIPTPNGGSLVEVAIGDMTITSGILRGGAVYEDNGSKGGTFGSVSLGRRTYMATAPSVNEGYIAEILTSPNADSATKQKIAEYLITRERPVSPSSSTSAVNASTGTGDAPPVVEPTRTGIDHITSTVGEVVPKVAPVVADATTKSVDSVTNMVEGVADDIASVSNDWSSTWDTTVIAFCIVAVLLLFAIGVLIWKVIVKVVAKKKEKASTLVDKIEEVVDGKFNITAENVDSEIRGNS
jgi:hypothetical protein